MTNVLVRLKVERAAAAHVRGLTVGVTMPLHFLSRLRIIQRQHQLGGCGRVQLLMAETWLRALLGQLAIRSSPI